MEDLADFFENKKILITGHTGFKGSWLSYILHTFDSEVVGYALKPHTTPNLFDVLNLNKKITSYFEDIRDFKKLDSIVKEEEPEIVFHLAAQPIVRHSYDDPLYTYETNTLGTANILQAIKNIGTIKSAIIITTDKVYNNKEVVWPYRENDELGGYDPYSASKACAELVIQSYIKSFFNEKTPVASVRAGNVIGGGDWSEDRIIPDIIRSVFEKKEPLTVRSPLAIRPWQHVLEPLFGYLTLAKGLYNNKTDLVGAWNFAPYESNETSVEELVKFSSKILENLRYEIKLDNTKHEAGILKLDASKARAYLKWSPILTIDETLEWTLEWYKSYYNQKDIINFTDNQIKNFLTRFYDD
jgi:CDP-glucose 4,6-dehydratase